MGGVVRAVRLAAAATSLAFVVGAGSAHAAAPTWQRARLRGGEIVLQAKAGRLDALHRQVARLGLETIAYDHLGMVAVRASESLAQRVAALPAVRYAHDTYRLSPLDHQSTPLVYDGRQQSVWNGGFDGRGVGVAVIDTGVDATHPDLKKHTVWNEVVVDSGLGLGATCDDCTTDADGHGTHVAGIAVGDGSASGGYHTGVAPGAWLYGFSVGNGFELVSVLSGVDELLARKAQGANILVANFSFGPSNDGSLRLDTTDPTVQAEKRLHDAGVTVVVAAGNDGVASNGDRPVSASKCDRDGVGDCMMNPLSVAPWVISVANSSKDADGGQPGSQHLDLASSRGDVVPETSLDGVPDILYRPTLTAPGYDILSARAIGVTPTVNCPHSTLEPTACTPDPGRPQDYPYYVAVSGTSMAAPQVSGAVAVIQSAARAKLGHYLAPDQVRQILIDSAAPMTATDVFWQWPCGVGPAQPCNDPGALLTGRPYESWQVGAGMLDVGRAVALVAP